MCYKLRYKFRWGVEGVGGLIRCRHEEGEIKGTPLKYHIHLNHKLCSTFECLLITS